MSLYQSFSDEDLILLLQEGQERAFTEIYERYHSLLYIYADKKLQNKQESQDVIQEVLFTLWNKRSNFSIQSTLASYLFTAVRNKAFDLFAHKKVQAKYLASLQGFMDQSDDATDHLVRENDLRALIEKEIQALPPKMREIFQLSRRERLSHREIAELLSISEHTVNTQIKRALKVLRARLGLFTWLMMFLLK